MKTSYIWSPPLRTLDCAWVGKMSDSNNQSCNSSWHGHWVCEHNIHMQSAVFELISVDQSCKEKSFRNKSWGINPLQRRRDLSLCKRFVERTTLRNLRRAHKTQSSLREDSHLATAPVGSGSSERAGHSSFSHHPILQFPIVACLGIRAFQFIKQRCMSANPSMKISTLPFQLSAIPKFIEAILTWGCKLKGKKIFEKCSVDIHAWSNSVKRQLLSKRLSSGLASLRIYPSSAATTFDLPPLPFIGILTNLDSLLLEI